MYSKKVFSWLGVACLLLSLGLTQAQAAQQNENNLKGHDGTWIFVDSAGNVSYVTCVSSNNSSGRAYSCSGNTYVPDGRTIPVYVDGVFTGTDTYQEKIISRFNEEGFPFPLILVVTGSGRFMDDDTSSFNQISRVYIDVNSDGIPDENEYVFTNPVAYGLVHRMLPIFKDIEFPDYPTTP